MTLLRFVGYFTHLRQLIGFNATVRFSVAYIKNKLFPPRGGRLGQVPVGNYVFNFPSMELFVGTFTEIFFKESYFLKPIKEVIHAIDCGTNIGVGLLYIKVMAPNAKVACFEPNPNARAVLQKNIDDNNWQNEVTVFPYALGKQKGSAEFFVDQDLKESTGGSLSKHMEIRGRKLRSYTVEIDTLSRYIDSTIDVLKMDIEGAEFEVLEDLISQKKLGFVQTMQLEYHYHPEHFRRPLSEILTILESEGFKTFTKSIANPSQVVGRDVVHAYMVFAWR